MKNVLVIDASPVFAEFLKDKFTSEKIENAFIQGKLDSIPKIISVFPDLVIVDIQEETPMDSMLEFLKRVKNDPNASRIPMIATGPLIEKNMIAVYAKLGIQKYFVKPIKFDIFFESVGHFLKHFFSMDTTPCVLEIHRNENIIFIEISKGLNREKLFLLRYRLSELIKNTALEAPKIIVMITNLDLTFVDGLNLELLLDNVKENPKVKPENVYILTVSGFVRDLIAGHPEYSGMKVSTDISQVLNSLVETTSSAHLSDIISERILSPSQMDNASLEMRFSLDLQPQETKAEENGVLQGKKISMLNDDAHLCELVKSEFNKLNIACDTYSDASSFLSDVTKENYSLVIIDILLPGTSGLEIIKRLKELPSAPLIFVYAQVPNREIVVHSLQMGAKQYLIKPQEPGVIVKKAVEVLNAETKR